jgi:uncharacterized protein (TIGR02145 family)
MRTKLFKIAQAATLGLAITFTLSCSSGALDGNSWGGGGGGGSCSTGETVRIGNQTWMKRNLNCNVSGSKCYSNDEANCAKYGRLYNWETARTVCPSGWHLPSYAEWTTLTDYVGGSSTAGTKLKSSTGWDAYSGVPAGTDEYGFSALPGGSGYSVGDFLSVGGSGYWWSASEYSSDGAYFLYMGYHYQSANSSTSLKSVLQSVRCLQD